LDRKPEADQERQLAEKCPPRNAFELFLNASIVFIGATGRGGARFRERIAVGAKPFSEPLLSGGVFSAVEAPRGGQGRPDGVHRATPALRLELSFPG